MVLFGVIDLFIVMPTRCDHAPGHYHCRVGIPGSTPDFGLVLDMQPVAQTHAHI